MDIKDCPFCGAWGADMNKHDENCYLRMIQESFESGMHSPDSLDMINRWAKAWNTRHIPEGYAIVPVEPSVDMIESSLNENDDPDNYWGSAESLNARIYKAMIKAAKEPNE